MRKIVVVNPASNSREVKTAIKHYLVYDKNNPKRFTRARTLAEARRLTDKLNQSAGFDQYGYLGIGAD